ncbi:Holliday junction resolvase RuvX [Altererythrobacter sp. C41]|nr:Holliday junction resolvase RuvX [Altererythrobacter sp. C41]
MRHPLAGRLHHELVDVRRTRRSGPRDRGLQRLARLRWDDARRKPDPLHQPAHRRDRRRSAGRGQPRDAHPQRRLFDRRAGSGRGARPLQRTRPAADRRSARSRQRGAAGQQLPRLRHPAVLAEREAGCRQSGRGVGSAALITDSSAEFGAALPGGGTLLALDLGTKTIGTATCDAGWQFATAGKTLPRGKFGRDLEALTAIVRERRVKGLVLGLPRNMDGSEGPRAQASRAYARNLSERLALPILLWDERWSTTSAERDLIGQDMSRRKRAERIDSHAAAVILQGAIDALTGSAF